MIKNMGKTDRAIRILAGAAIIGAGFYFQTWLGAIGAVLIITSIIAWCPLYVPFKISTKND